MFCPFFFKFSLFDPLAKYILGLENSNPEEPQRKKHSRFVVRLDPDFSCSTIKIKEHQAGLNRMYFGVTGEGKALANSQLVQDRAYFEVKVTKPGSIGIGVSKNTQEHLKQRVGEDSESWGVVLSKASHKVKEGTVIGCMFDQSDFPAVVSYFIDEEVLEGTKVTGMRGPVVPAISLHDSAEVEVMFDSQLLEKSPPSGFSPIIFSQNFMF